MRESKLKEHCSTAVAAIAKSRPVLQVTLQVKVQALRGKRKITERERERESVCLSKTSFDGDHFTRECGE